MQNRKTLIVFKINSDAQKIIGWIPEKIASKLIIKKDPVSVNIP